jgi:hypothetical protein
MARFHCCWQDERLHDLLEAMRARFKAVVATLGAAAEYQTAPGQQVAPRHNVAGPPQRVEAGQLPSLSF